MKLFSAVAAGAALLYASSAIADLDPWTDYEPSEAVWSVTTVKVDSNMGDAYLEGIKNTWVKGNEIAKKLGQIEDYHIYRSQLPESGDFNLLLVIKFASGSDLEPNKKRYDAFIKEWGKSQADDATEYAQKNYPAMREIVGEYQFREIKLK
ncbi:MAG: hypothetical protein OER80_03735 [Gammaproteobacteria bacterium]|nr:hypothetical protein [Gammaproteobacteria bacterium]MDH3768245.1 hypothetical protein [Gammaproteobacteria bacterium]